MLATPLIVTIVAEAIVLLAMGVLLVSLSDATSRLIVGIVLIVFAAIVASFLAFPGAYRYLRTMTAACEN